MKTQHTPWLNETVLTPDGRWGKITGLGGFVGEVRVLFHDGHHEDFKPEKLLSKKLIAAAPELLEALEKAYPYVTDEAICSLIIDAIKKAKGE